MPVKSVICNQLSQLAGVPSDINTYNVALDVCESHTLSLYRIEEIINTSGPVFTKILILRISLILRIFLRIVVFLRKILRIPIHKYSYS